ncbi:MAG: DNA polymerase III subunit gamma/tau [Bacteroidetes bacterium]|nr:DNA polymerase III subunit gamma/tau [Bacteroidota bacterium]
MSQYLVSARKYRPQTFDTVVGQEHITTTLKNAIRSGHLAHAFLFCGPRGVGKTTCARILAKTINCENLSSDTEACGTCASCRAFQDNTSFNIFELDAASNNSVDDIRELVNGVRFAPQQGCYKIYIIDEVHMLSPAAFNAFLKTLEEPPPYAIFILATTEKHKILPTILSRCQIFDFKRITSSDTVAHLQGIAQREGLQAEEEALHVIAQKSEGCMRDSLSMLDRIASFTEGVVSYAATMEHLAMLDADFYFGLSDAMLGQDVSDALLRFDTVLEKGFEGNVVLEGLGTHFRNLLLCKDARMAKLLDLPNTHKRKYHEKSLQAPPSFLLSALNIVNDSELHYREAANKRLHVELCLIRLCYLLQATAAQPIEASEQKKTPERSVQPTPSGARPPAPAPAIPPQEKPTETAPFPQPSLPPSTPSNSGIVAEEEPVFSTPNRQEGRRVSSGILRNLEDRLAGATAPEPIAGKALNQEQLDELFEAFCKKVQESGRGVVYGQVRMMHAQCKAEDEARIISPTSLTDSYAQNLRNELTEFFSAALKRTIRVTTEVIADPSGASAQPQALSRQELYQAMLQKNPVLGTLKDDLNLSLDF